MMKRVLGIYPDPERATEAYRHLFAAGFPATSISVLVANTPEGQGYMASLEGHPTEGARYGVEVGGALGAVAGGVLALPAIGVIGLGPLIAALGGAVAGGASGGLLGALVGQGIPANEAELRRKEIEKGAVVVGVDTDRSRAEDARLHLAAVAHADVVVLDHHEGEMTEE